MADVDYSSEEWRPIPGLDGYEASSLGRVRSVDRRVPFVCKWGQETSRFAPGRVLRLFPHKQTRYLQVKVTIKNQTKTLQLSRAVCAAFHGAPPSTTHQAAHNDGNFMNNLPKNLRWATPSENHCDKRTHGTHIAGERHYKAKLKQAQVEAIRPLRGKVSAGRIAQAHGVSPQVIYDIWQGRAWRQNVIP